MLESRKLKVDAFKTASAASGFNPVTDTAGAIVALFRNQRK